jgi:hypothetical protein
VLQQHISNEGFLPGAARKYKHRTKFLNRKVRTETSVAAPKGIQKNRTRHTLDTVDFRLKDQEKRKF